MTCAWTTAIVAAAMALSVHAALAGDTIDFETIPGVGDPVDDMPIGDQYWDSHGVRFRLESGTLPVLAQVGNPRTAFEPSDTPAAGQGTGSFFLTDDGELAGLEAEPLIVEYAMPTDAASGVVLDMDADEQFTIEARGEDGSVLTTVIVTAGDPGTGDAIATRWSFSRGEADIHSIRFVGTREASGAFGLGFDNFSAFSNVPVDSKTWSQIKADHLGGSGE